MEEHVLDSYDSKETSVVNTGCKKSWYFLLARGVITSEEVFSTELIS
jgi:hypothetical protein